MIEIERYLTRPDQTLRQVMRVIEGTKRGIAVVVDSHRQLLGTITDGDIRRAILDGHPLEESASDLCSRHADPVTASVGTSNADLVSLMADCDLRHIPLLGGDGSVVDVAVLSDLVTPREPEVSAVIMAGGYGQRLRPLTKHVPKPMLPVGDRPLLQRLVEQIRDAGIGRVSLSTHYMSEVIADHFGSGEDFGVQIDYLREDEPLGTAGALGLVAEREGPVLVVNGDILTGVDFRAFSAFHTEHNADMTIAVREVSVSVPYGVIETEGFRVTKVTEKPVVKYLANAGVYLLGPRAMASIPVGVSYDMTELITDLVQSEAQVVSFPVLEYWLDIGQISDYEQAEKDVSSGRI
jgi:dTDP-glucose pyrophosphorylase